MSDDDLAYSSDHLWQREHDDCPDDVEETQLGEDFLVKYGHSLCDSEIEQTWISREIAESEADSRNAGEAGEAMSDIQGFDGHDVPLWG